MHQSHCSLVSLLVLAKSTFYQVVQSSPAPQNGTCKIRKNSEMCDLYEEDARPHLTLTLTLTLKILILIQWQAAVIICWAAMAVLVILFIYAGMILPISAESLHFLFYESHFFPSDMTSTVGSAHPG